MMAPPTPTTTPMMVFFVDLDMPDEPLLVPFWESEAGSVDLLEEVELVGAEV